MYSTDLDDITDAIDLLKETIEEDPAGCDRAALLASAAADFNLNPVLLARKFAEQWGPHDQFNPPSKDEQRAKQLAAARAVADQWIKKYVGCPTQFGRQFTFDGEDFLFVVLQSGQPQWGLKAVRISDGAQQRFSRAAWDGIFKQIAA